MAEQEDIICGSPWRKPSSTHRIKKLKNQKRALQDRLFESSESPTKKPKTTPAPLMKKHVNIFATKKFPKNSNLDSRPDSSSSALDDSACEDSTLMDLLGFRPVTEEIKVSRPLTFSRLLPTTPEKGSQAGDITPEKHMGLPMLSPLKSFVNQRIEEGDLLSSSSSPPRKTLVPRRLPLSPSFSAKSKDFGKSRSRLTYLPPPSDGGPDWSKDLCLDWSLKSSLNIISPNAFGWSSDLKTSEESSGVSAFVRCINIEPPDSFHPSCPSTGSSQLDTSLGAQFHQCCLYWQHPSVPTLSLFPRNNQGSAVTGQKSATVAIRPSIRFEKTAVDSMHQDWIEAFRSAFNLLKARQCPFFYICANNFTCLFCSAGIQGDEQTQIYVTPTTKAFRDALKAKGISFSVPYAQVEKSSHNHSADTSINDEDGNEEEQEAEVPGAREQWLEELGLSQDVKVIVPPASSQNTEISSGKKSSHSLILISASDTLPFFNFLIDMKNLVAKVGQFAGMPPTILSPTAFHGATLKTLKVQQKKLTVDSTTLNAIDMKGPILPHVLHMLTSLLNKTVKNYKIRVRTLESTIPLNLYSNMSQVQGRVKPSAFDLQNLSDCGLKKEILEVFCKNDSCDTIVEMIEGKREMYRWY